MSRCMTHASVARKREQSQSAVDAGKDRADKVWEKGDDDHVLSPVLMFVSACFRVWRIFVFHSQCK